MAIEDFFNNEIQQGILWWCCTGDKKSSFNGGDGDGNDDGDSDGDGACFWL